MSTDRLGRRRDTNDENVPPQSVGSPGIGVAPKVSVLLPHLTPPTKEEATHYYRDFPSKPILLGRTSSGVSKWPPALVPYTDNDVLFPIWSRLPTRLLSPIGKHKIRSCWYEKVQPLVVTSLQHLPWTSIDVFRIGYDTVTVFKRPVVVWVGLSSDDIPWADIARALRVIRKILDDAGLNDVQCEMRCSPVSFLGGPRLIAKDEKLLSDNMLHKLLPLSTALGQSCALGAAHDQISGALGLFLIGSQPSGGKDDTVKQEKDVPLWALACRHVALPYSHYPDNNFYNRKTSDQPVHQIVTPSTTQMNSILPDCELELITLLQPPLIRIAKDPDNERCPPLGTDLDTICKIGDLDQLAAELLPHAEELVKWIAEDPKTPARNLALIEGYLRVLQTWKPFASIESRIIGQVYLSPPLKQHRWAGSGARPHLWSRDWCLIQLDRSKFPDNGSSLRYEVSLEGGSSVAVMARRLGPHFKEKGHGFRYPESRFLTLSGHVSLSEIQNPTALDANGEECFLVGKRGPVSGLTWGCPSELMSTIRHCIPGEEFITQEWAVKGSIESKAFSMHGDSGAVVFSADGRVAGVLTSGADPTSGFGCDVTYVTPIEPLLDDVRETLGEDINLL